MFLCPTCGSRYDLAEGVQECPRDGAPLIDSKRDPLVGTSLASKYELVELIGVGACSRVYRAKQGSLAREVAAKLLLDTLRFDERKLLRFEREAKTVASLKHPNIVSVFDFGVEPQPFIIMEYLNGSNLAQVLKDGKAFTVNETIGMLVQLCGALQTAHENGIVHRDLKPANITVIRDGPSATVKVLDFGLARATEVDGQSVVQLTATGQILGSPAYMSPEQCLGSRVDSRSDIYSFGCVMHELLTGQIAFPAGSPAECMQRQLHEAPRSISDVCPEKQFPKELECIVSRCLEKNPEARYQSMLDIKADLTAVGQEHEGSHVWQYAKLPSSTNRFREIAKRRGFKALVASLALLLCGSGLIALNWHPIMDAAWQYNYQQGKKFLAAKDFANAESRFKTSLALVDTFDPDDWHRMRSLFQLEKLYASNPAKSKEVTELINAFGMRNPLWVAKFREAKKAEALAHHKRAQDAWRDLAEYQRDSSAHGLLLAISLSELGLAYHRQAKLKEAEAAYREALALRYKYGDKDDSKTATVLGRLGEVCENLHTPAEAQALFEEAITIRSNDLGPSHPQNAWLLGRLADTYWDLNDLARAESTYKNAIAILENSPERAKYWEFAPPLYTGLANIYLETGRGSLAEPLYLQCLAMKTQAYGPDHPYICDTLENLGICRWKQHRYDEAKNLLRKAYLIRRKALGENNLFTLRSLDLYARYNKDKVESARLFAKAAQVKAQMDTAAQGNN